MPLPIVLRELRGVLPFFDVESAFEVFESYKRLETELTLCEVASVLR